MDTRVALIGIIVENKDATDRLNALLHQYAPYIIGRMGIPHQKREISIISIVIDAPADKISALSGKLGMLPGINAKTLYAKIPTATERTDD
ncbi:MAG: iron-only hydrogenase system regulator [Clostridiales bacterium]|nr:iron-only hydrogenase system regulator [Clostridiales bacterium]